MKKYEKLYRLSRSLLKKAKNINPVASPPGFLFAKVFLEDTDRIYPENHQTKETISRS